MWFRNFFLLFTFLVLPFSAHAVSVKDIQGYWKTPGHPDFVTIIRDPYIWWMTPDFAAVYRFQIIEEAKDQVVLQTELLAMVDNVRPGGITYRSNEGTLERFSLTKKGVLRHKICKDGFSVYSEDGNEKSREKLLDDYRLSSCAVYVHEWYDPEELIHPVAADQNKMPLHYQMIAPELLPWMHKDSYVEAGKVKGPPMAGPR
jgi:hypothetical protein